MLLCGSSCHVCNQAPKACLIMQVGTGNRSEKIKTYNFKDSRVSDHRTKVNYDLNKIMGGDLETSIMALTALDQQERLAELAAGTKEVATV